MKRRDFNQKSVLLGAGLLFGSSGVIAKTYLTVEQAKKIIWPNIELEPFEVILDKAQMKSIKASSETRVRLNKVKGFKSKDNQWLIIDQVVGKHEFIDLAVGLDSEGKVTAVEVLTYRESYGDEIMNPKWQAQFLGKGTEEILKLDVQIKNISGATMSCRHVTDGINRLTHTWEQVLKDI